MPRGRKSSASFTTDPMLLNAMLEGLELQKQRLDAQIATVRAALGKGRPGRPPASASAAPVVAAAPAAAPVARKRKPLSAAARKAIAAAQKKRWAEFRKKQGEE